MTPNEKTAEIKRYSKSMIMKEEKSLHFLRFVKWTDHQAAMKELDETLSEQTFLESRIHALESALKAKEKEILHLKKREHIAGCYWVYGDCTCLEIYQKETGKL